MKRLFVFALALMLVATGCGGNGNSSSTAEISAPPAVEQEEPDEIDQPQVQPPQEGDEEEEAEQAELIENEYEGLTISAAVLERKAILPGFAVPITVKVANTGDRTVLYTKGSGAVEVPDAIVLHAPDLQPVRTKDRLGILTMDFVTAELAPGEELEYVLHVMAIKPNEKFDDYTYDLYGEDESYIGDLEWPDLQEKHSDLEAVEPGSYTVEVEFRYALADENGEGTPLGVPTGYAKAECVIGVSD